VHAGSLIQGAGWFSMAERGGDPAMLRLKNVAILLACAVVTIVLFVILENMFAPSFTKCLGEVAARQGDFLDRQVTCSLKLVNERNGFFSAIAALVVACFTITLWVTNSSQLRHARDVDRAYLTGGGDSYTDAAGNMLWRLDVENIGRTAAFLSHYEVQFATVAEAKIEKRVHERYRLDDRLAPAGDSPSTAKQFKTTIPFQAGKGFVYGAVWYTDIWESRTAFGSSCAS
jgi:hypothetical protein